MHVRSLKKIKAYQFVGRVTKTGAIVRFHCDLFHPPAEGESCHVTGCVFDTQSKLVKCQVRRGTNSSDDSDEGDEGDKDDEGDRDNEDDEGDEGDEGDKGDEGDEDDKANPRQTEPDAILESAKPPAVPRKRARISFDT